MRRAATFSLAVLFCAAAAAQQPLAQAPSIEVELLELEQDVDKALLREALMLQGRQDVQGLLDPRSEKTRFSEDRKALREFIAKKKDAIIERSAELRKTRITRTWDATTAVVSPDGEPAKVDRPAVYEKVADAQIEVQLLQAQRNLLQPLLDQAIQALVAADFAASNDERQRGKADGARKAYEKIKAKYVEHSKRLQLKQYEAQSMQPMGGMGGMGGGSMQPMGGMGGGFR